MPNNEQDLRQYLNIPKDALVLGRNGGWETFDILGEKGIYYSNKNDILEILLSLDKKYLNSNEWNMYQDYTPEKVVEQFKNIYL